MFSKYIDQNICRPKYIDSKYIDHNISKYMQNVYFFLKTSQHTLQILGKSTKKYEGNLGLGEAII